MPTRGYAFDGETADRLMAMLDAWESRPGDKPRAPRRGRRTAVNVQRLKVTDATAAGTTAGVDYFHCRTLRFDPTDGTWSELFDYDDAFVFSPSGGTFSVDDEIDAKGVGAVTVAGATRPAFAFISGTTGGDFVQVRVTGQYVKDDPLLVALPSGYCYYPVEDVEGPTGPLVNPTNGTQRWCIFRYTDAIIDNGSAPFTVVGVDGTKVHLARKLNWSYAPDDGVTLHTGESRPVCYSHETAYLIAIDCSGTAPEGVPEG